MKKMVSYSLEAQVIIVIGICLVTSYLLNLFFKKYNLPLMIAPLLIGLSINFMLQNGFFSYIPKFSEILGIFANFGLIVILFFVGLKVEFHFMRNLSKNSSIMAINAGHTPFFFGLFATYIYTRNWIEALFVGIALAITAEEVAVGVLEELKMINKRVGQLIIEAGIIGDIFEITAIALLGLLLRTQIISNFTIFTLLFDFFMFLLIVLLMRYVLIEYLLRIVGKKARKFEYFGLAFVILLIITMSAEIFGFSSIIGALLAGILLKDKFHQDKLYVAEHHIVETIEVFNFGVFHPLVFIWIGLSVDLSLIFRNINFGIVLTILAISGKLIGSVLGNYFCKEPWKEGILIGWGLNARGATELFALLIAQNQGFVSSDVFSAVVFMAIITTIISPIVFKYLVLKGFGMYKHRKYKGEHVHEVAVVS